MTSSYVALPIPQTNAPISLEVTIASPRPVSAYAEEQLASEYVGQLSWAAHTINNARNQSAWLILYICRTDGVWRYHSQEHCLTRHLDRDMRRALAHAAWNRWFIAQAPCVFVITTAPKRGKGGRCKEQWQLHHPLVEAGRAVERILLQSAVLGLASVPVSEFDDAKVKCDLVLSRQEEPLCLMPMGWPAPQ